MLRLELYAGILIKTNRIGQKLKKIIWIIKALLRLHTDQYVMEKSFILKTSILRITRINGYIYTFHQTQRKKRLECIQ